MTHNAREVNLCVMLKNLELSNIEEWEVLFLLLFSVVYPHHLDQRLAKNIVFNK